MRTVFTANEEDIKKVQVTMQFTMPISDWQALLKELNTQSQDVWPACTFRAEVRAALEKLNSSVNQIVDFGGK